MRKQISLDYLKKHDIDPKDCFLYWLCGYTQKEWLQLTYEQRNEYSKAWELLGRVHPKTPFAGGMSLSDYEREDDLRRDQDREDDEIFRERYR